MTQRPNAKLTPKGCETLVSRMESGLGVAEAARQMGVSRQTAGKWLHRRGPVTRVSYERESPGEFVYVDAKKVPRIPDGGGRRALGRGCGSARGAGVVCLHVAVDDLGRVAYAELLPDERKGTCAAFMERSCASSRAWACGPGA